MPDVLTAEERAAISSYKGPIHRIPMGESAFLQAYEYRDGQLRLREEYIDNCKRLTPMAHRAGGTSTRVETRREKLRLLIAKGKNVEEIAQVLGVAEYLVKSDAKKIGVEVRPAPRDEYNFHKEAAKRAAVDAQILDAYTPDLTISEIAERIGETYERVRLRVRAMGLKVRRGNGVARAKRTV